MKLRAISFLYVIFAVGCSTAPSPTHFNGWAMTMPYHITVGKKVNAREQKQISLIIQNTFTEIDQTVNNWNPNSEVSLFNQQLAGLKHIPSQHLDYLLTLCDQMHQRTAGKFDPTIDPLTQLWKSALAQGIKPTQEQLSLVQKSIGWHHIHLEAKCIWKDEAQTSLDLCALSKGYCIDLLAERLATAGFAHVFIEWAGEIRAMGHHPSGRPWTIQIEPMQQVTSLHNGAIATSGDYAQKEWGQGYFHIIDPIAGQPLQKHPESIVATTVIAPTCAMADALATALMLFKSKEEAEKWSKAIVEQMPAVSVWIFTR